MTWGLRPVSDLPPFRARKPFCRSRQSLGVARLLARSLTEENKREDNPQPPSWVNDANASYRADRAEFDLLWEETVASCNSSYPRGVPLALLRGSSSSL